MMPIKSIVRSASFFTVMFTIVTLVSCKEEDPRKTILQKKWSYYEANLNGQTISGKELGSPTLEFHEDGSYTYTTGPNEETGKWKLKKDHLITKKSDSEEDITYNILEMTEKKVTLEMMIDTIDFSYTLVPYQEK